MNDNTIKFVVPEDSSEEMKTILTAVYGALSEKGYNPINQIKKDVPIGHVLFRIKLSAAKRQGRF